MQTATVKISLALATLFGIGFIPGPTGTYGSAATALIYWAFGARIGAISAAWQVGILLALTALGILVSEIVAQARRDPDPSIVIIDEVVGQLAALLLLPITVTNLLLGFALFRVFDIVKPFPARQLERLHGGFGIVLDDIAAGIYANIVLRILIKLFPQYL
jgi:phosphatidylglycerophosphatase A